MGTCKCGGERRTSPINNYIVPVGLLGVENVTLVNGVTQEICDGCGYQKIHIPDIPGLVAAVAMARVKLPYKLSNQEFKFLRKALDVSAKDMAAYLEVAPETISRWESGKQAVGAQSERLLRLAAIALLQSKARAVDPGMETVAQMTIQSVFDPNAIVGQMRFVRVEVLENRKTDPEPLWRDDRKAA